MKGVGRWLKSSVERVRSKWVAIPTLTHNQVRMPHQRVETGDRDAVHGPLERRPGSLAGRVLKSSEVSSSAQYLQG